MLIPLRTLLPSLTETDPVGMSHCLVQPTYRSEVGWGAGDLWLMAVGGSWCGIIAGC